MPVTDEGMVRDPTKPQLQNALVPIQVTEEEMDREPLKPQQSRNA
jgi:hypothetical protein